MRAVDDPARPCRAIRRRSSGPARSWRCRLRPARLPPSRARSARTTSRTASAAATTPMPPTTLRRADQEAALAFVYAVRSARHSAPRPLPCRSNAVRLPCRAPVLKRRSTRKPVDYKGFARSRRKPRRRTTLEFRSESAGCARRRRAAVAGSRRRAIIADSSSERVQPVLRKLLAAFRAGLHAVPRRAVRRRDAAPGSAAARLRTSAGSVVLLQETARRRSRRRQVASYADAAKKAMPAVVNIYTSKEMRQRNPLLDDPLLRRYFPDLAERVPRAARDEPRLGRHRSRRRLRADQPPRDRRRRRHPARARRRPPDRARTSAASIPSPTSRC